MARRTRKVGISARFASRYGVKVRKRIQDIETESRKRHLCPKCQYSAVRRVSTGIWTCLHCGLKFAGGAYVPVAVRGVKREEELAAETAPARDVAAGKAEPNAPEPAASQPAKATPAKK